MAVREQEYTAFFPFCGIGAGAMGFLRAHVKLFGAEAGFRILGGIDLDALACKGFTYLTGAPALRVDIATLTVAALVGFLHGEVPDVVLSLPPCKSFSRLTSKRARRLRKYRLMNLLALQWIRLMLAAWGTQPPRLVLLENVEGIATYGSALLRKIRSLLRAHGYIVSPGETHDCGELGGLAQHRKRYLLVARHAGSVPNLLYQPVRKKVRACGEVLGQLPLPGHPSAGPLHKLPNISALNWWRLSLIPPGGDWQDLPGMGDRTSKARKAWTQKGEKTPGEVHYFKGKYSVLVWDLPARTVIGGPSNGACYVADPTVAPGGARFNNVFTVGDWYQPLGAVTAGAGPSSGGWSVADVRPDLGPAAHTCLWRMVGWDAACVTVTGATRPGQGAPSVADLRVPTRWNDGVLGIQPWDVPAGTITGGAGITTGRFALADLRVNSRQPHTYGVLPWDGAAHTISGNTVPGGGPFSVADVRVPTCFREGYGVLGWDAAAGTVKGQAWVTTGRYALADLRIPTHNPRRHAAKYAMLAWAEPARTITGTDGRVGSGAPNVEDARVGLEGFGHVLRLHGWGDPCGTITAANSPSNGALSIADARVRCKARNGFYGMLAWVAPADTVTGALQIDNGRAAVADPRAVHGDGLVVHWYPRGLTDRPGFPLFLPSVSGFWHRPLTTLELAVLQGLPATIDGQPLRLHGSSAKIREHIGNAVPVTAAQAIAEEMLKTLVGADLETWALSSGGAVWVDGEGEATPMEVVQ